MKGQAREILMELLENLEHAQSVEDVRLAAGIASRRLLLEAIDQEPQQGLKLVELLPERGNLVAEG